MAGSRVLVLIPSYNHGSFIEERVQSVLNQEHKAFDVLLIDDGSTDNTASYLRSLSADNLTVRIRDRNSGSPFSAWRDAAKIADPYDYVWIAESDDVAQSAFLARAVAALDASPGSAFYYCNSWHIDEDGEKIGHTINYLGHHFKGHNWLSAAEIEGREFNNRYQIFGNAVPNMSSMVMRRESFQAAVDDQLDRYRLAADWFFVGRLADTGNVLFDPWSGNGFRHHGRTARAETRLERLTFEYFRAVQLVSKLKGVERSQFEEAMKRCTVMFIHERGSAVKFLRQGFRSDPAGMIQVLLHLVGRALRHPRLLGGAMSYISRRSAR
jgi:glycosyltransferase involved in cell wall biosynthesis